MIERTPKRKKPRLIRMYIVNRRHELNLSQYKASVRMGLDHCTFNQIENGKLGGLMNAKKLISLAEALEWDLEYLVKQEASYLDAVESQN